MLHLFLMRLLDSSDSVLISTPDPAEPCLSVGLVAIQKYGLLGSYPHS